MLDLKYYEHFGKLHDFKKYLELMEAQLEEAKRLSSSTEFAGYDLSDPEQENEYLSLKGQHDDYYDENLGGIFHRSFIISFYSYIELWFEGLCRIVQKTDGRTRLLLKDLKGDSLERVNRYLEIVLAIKISDTPEWGFIRDLKRVRNCLVHADGVIERVSSNDDKKRLWKLVEGNSDGGKSSGITVDEPLRVLMKIKDERRIMAAKENAKLVILQMFCSQSIGATEALFRAALKLAKIYP